MSRRAMAVGTRKIADTTCEATNSHSNQQLHCGVQGGHGFVDGCSGAWGGGDESSSGAAPTPEFLDQRAPLPDVLLKDKRVGSYFTGFPAIGWDPESEFNYGAAVQWFDNGPADSPFFRYTPYRKRLAAAASGSTGGSRRADWFRPAL